MSTIRKKYITKLYLDEDNIDKITEAKLLKLLTSDNNIYSGSVKFKSIKAIEFINDSNFNLDTFKKQLDNLGLKFYDIKMESGEVNLEIDDILEFRTTIIDVTCQSCIQSIRSILEDKILIIDLQFNFVSKQLVIQYKLKHIKFTSEDIINSIEELGYTINKENNEHDNILVKLKQHFYHDVKLLLFSLIFTLPIFFIDMILRFTLDHESDVYKGLFNNYIFAKISINVLLSFILTTLALILLGRSYIYKSLKSVIKSKVMNMDLLISLAILISYLVSIILVIQYQFNHNPELHTFFEVCTFLLSFIFLGNTITSWLKFNTFKKFFNILKNEQNNKVDLLLNYKEKGLKCETMKVDYERLKVNDIIKINPGESIPVDCIIIEGNSTINEAMLTGESKPNSKSIGDTVIGGTININSYLILQVTQVGADTQFYKIMKLIEDAQLNQTHLQSIIDTWCQYFIPSIFILSLITFIIWLILGFTNNIKKEWLMHYNDDFLTFTTFIALSVLVIACPCALSMVSPTVVMVASGISSKLGILNKKGGLCLELSNKVDIICFDKTGTLTMGDPVVTDIYFDSSLNLNSNWKLNVIIWDSIGYLTKFSNHPISKCLLNHCKLVLSLSKDNESEEKLNHLDAFQELSGLGLIADIQLNEDIEELYYSQTTTDKIQLLIGNEKLMKQQEYKILDDTILLNQKKYNELGKSTVFIGIKPITESEQEGIIIGVIAINDILRPEAIKLIKSIQQKDIEVYMLTGDNELSAKYFAKQLNIDHILFNVLPSQKLDKIKYLQKGMHRKIVMMVGDGINDSPALAQADIGVAIGHTSSDITLNSADIILLQPNLNLINTFLNLSSKSYFHIKFGLFLSLIYNLIAVPIAAGALLPVINDIVPPYLAALAMVCSSLSIFLNALILRWRFKG